MTRTEILADMTHLYPTEMGGFIGFTLSFMDDSGSDVLVRITPDNLYELGNKIKATLSLWEKPHCLASKVKEE